MPFWNRTTFLSLFRLSRNFRHVYFSHSVIALRIMYFSLSSEKTGNQYVLNSTLSTIFFCICVAWNLEPGYALCIDDFGIIVKSVNKDRPMKAKNCSFSTDDLYLEFDFFFRVIWSFWNTGFYLQNDLFSEVTFSAGLTVFCFIMHFCIAYSKNCTFTACDC